MLRKTCDRCGKDMGIVYGFTFPTCGVETNLKETDLSIIWVRNGKSRSIDLCDTCDQKVRNYIFYSCGNSKEDGDVE